MSNRNAKRTAFAAGVVALFSIAVPVFVCAVMLQSDVLFVLAFLVAFISLAAIVPLALASNALTPPYGLFGTATLEDIPESLRGKHWIVTSGRIGDHYWARGWLPISCSQDGLALSLISGDCVFVRRCRIQSVAAIGWNQVEILHTDEQVHSPIIVGRRGYDELKRWLPDLVH